MPALHYLDFDFSEDADGHGSFDAMASAGPAQQPALEAEVIGLLTWAHRSFPGSRAPLDEGGEWDYALHGVLESTQPLEIEHEPGELCLRLMRAGAPAPPRLTLTLTLTGTPAFCAALRQEFETS